ncbi:agmatinase [Nesterenkonia sphaerica]|uniref:Agmatinase n=1 Tax=Nesterenkonia sphaerica TaxID=1804988 RepID=A0A5R9AAR9_9MICC|nr:agmatinase [Nesterenkonia sphaerica]TLP75728.1 agmatinase [Nesterenkonia sphaerica]
MQHIDSSDELPIGPVDGQASPRFAGLTTFARLPRRDQAPRHDVAVVGVPFDSGVTFRPGARFGPGAIREASRLLRPYNPAGDVSPFASMQVVDAGDIDCTPFDISKALEQIQAGVGDLIRDNRRVLLLGGDHTIALGALRAIYEAHGPVALVHFDAHLDTWGPYMDTPVTHGTPFRNAIEEGLLIKEHSAHVGIRGPLYGPEDLADDENLGFSIVHAREFHTEKFLDIMQRVRRRVGDAPVYISIDIDVLDPAHAPGTGTPEAGGLTSRELLELLRGLKGINLVGADVVEVSPPYDHAAVTSVAASHCAYDLISLMAHVHNQD